MSWDNEKNSQSNLGNGRSNTNNSQINSYTSSTVDNFTPITILDQEVIELEKKLRKSEKNPLGIIISGVLVALFGLIVWFIAFKWAQIFVSLPLNDPLMKSYTLFFFLLVLCQIIFQSVYEIADSKKFGLDNIAAILYVLNFLGGWFLFSWLTDFYFKNVYGGLSASAITPENYQWGSAWFFGFLFMFSFTFFIPAIHFGTIAVLEMILFGRNRKQFVNEIKGQPAFQEKGFIRAGNSAVLGDPSRHPDLILTELLTKEEIDYKAGLIINEKANLHESFIKQKAEEFGFAYRNTKVPPTNFDLSQWKIPPADYDRNYKALQKIINPPEKILWETPVTVELLKYSGDGILVATNIGFLLGVLEAKEWEEEPDNYEIGIIGRGLDLKFHNPVDGTKIAKASENGSKRIGIMVEWSDIIGQIYSSEQKVHCYVKGNKGVLEIKMNVKAKTNELIDDLNTRKKAFLNLLVATRGSRFG